MSKTKGWLSFFLTAASAAALASCSTTDQEHLEHEGLSQYDVQFPKSLHNTPGDGTVYRDIEMED